MAQVKVGDRVSTNATKDKKGTPLAQKIRDNTWIVSQIGISSDPNWVVLKNDDGVVMAAVDKSTVTVVNTSTETKKTPKVDSKGTIKFASASDMERQSPEIEKGLKQLLSLAIPPEILKCTMRLFGLPHQFTNYCDYRSYSAGSNKDISTSYNLIGRTFATNIMMEAPVVTIIPCKPTYLPNAKNAKGIAASTIAASNGDFSAMIAALQEENIHDRLRYYDVANDYKIYMRYVNLLCHSAAKLMDLDGVAIDGTTLGKYDWKNYRWTAKSYRTALQNVASNSEDNGYSALNALKKSYSELAKQLRYVSNETKKTFQSIFGSDGPGAFEENDSLKNMSSEEQTVSISDFLQFYVDASSGLSESADNATGPSKISGIFDTASDLTKEIAFIGNSGGLEMTEFNNAVDEGADKMLAKLQEQFDGKISGLLGKMTSAATNVIRGDVMIFPEIYQSSKYSKNYTVSIDLRTPYGNDYCYYMNVLVPLFHLLCLAIPKQSTANTYGAPFLIKAYYPGVFSCNMGIISSITIDKNMSGDAWSMDGYPNEVKVTLNITDLYSDLSMSSPDDAVLFMSNSSLIEYLCTNCGININTPNLSRRVMLLVQGFQDKLSNIGENIYMGIFGHLEDKILSIIGS